MKKLFDSFFFLIIPSKESIKMKAFLKKHSFELFTSLLILGMIILFFCPILLLNTKEKPMVTIPFLNVYSVSTIFLLLIPLSLFLLTSILTFFFQTKIIRWIDLTFSLYLLAIAISYQFYFQFIFVGVFFAILLPSLMVLVAIINLYFSYRH